jgi:hypothetical protein
VLGAHPHPNDRRPEMVKVDDLPLTLVYDEHGRVVYQVDEASRFGEKIAEGDPKYADFAPFESASAIARFDGTYGLRRFSDSLDPKKDGNATDEPDGMDCSYGLPIMEPGQHVEELPGSDQAVLWLGEFTPAATGAPGLLAIAGTRVYRRIGVGVWSQITTLPASPGTDARVTTFNGRLIIGFGDAHVAIWTDDLTTWPDVEDALGGPIYIWACTADHSNVYVAGGPALSNHNQVMSSTTGNDYADGVDCGRPDIYIHSLAPGGGLVLVYIGKQNELGCLTNDATYQILIPFDTYEANNGHLLRWWLGRQDDQQRGPLALHFLREQHLWQYAPASDTTGEARDVTPWADPTRRPYAIKGLPTAAAGTHRWLYYAVTNMDGATWVLKRDAMTGSTTPYLSLGKRACRALVVTHQLGLNPCLMYGYGEHVAYSVVPLYGEWPLDDRNCLPGETRVASGALITGVSRRWYEGDLITIRTVQGHQLSGTANHPVLTHRGWVGFGELQVGDDVISSRLGQEVGVADPHEDYAQPSIREVFDFAAMLGDTQRVPGRQPQFHGDGSDEAVDIVTTDGFLLDHVQASCTQPVGQQEFSRPDLVTSALSVERQIVPMGSRARAATNRVVRRLDEHVPFQQSHVVPAHQLRVSTVTNGLTHAREPALESRRADPNRARQGEGGLPCAVSTDRIVGINREPFRGHVYNLQTTVGHYLANGTVVHNCDYRVGTATLSLPAFDLNLPDEDKILLSVRIIADDLDPVARYFEVEYAVDGGPWLALGLANQSPRSEIDFDREIDIMKAKRCALRLIAHNLDGATTMVLLGVVLHWSLNAKPYRRWTFQASLPVGRTQLPGSDSSNPERLPASYTRYWYMPPMTCEWFPITACWPEVCAGSLVIESDVTNDLGSETIYPRWTIHGPCGAVDIRNLTSGEWLTVVRDVSFAESLVINMDPARQTVVDSVGRAIPTAQVFGTFWGLQPGLVAFRVTVEGASLGTYVVATRRP